MVVFRTIEGKSLDELADNINEFTKTLGMLNKDVEIVTTSPTLTGYKVLIKYDDEAHYA